jgi:hypothetical protein
MLQTFLLFKKQFLRQYLPSSKTNVQIKIYGVLSTIMPVLECAAGDVRFHPSAKLQDTSFRPICRSHVNMFVI